MTERTDICVDAVQRGWSIHQSDMATVFGYEGHQLVVRWSDNGVATAAELHRGDTVVDRRGWFPDREIGAWVREQLADLPRQGLARVRRLLLDSVAEATGGIDA